MQPFKREGCGHRSIPTNTHQLTKRVSWRSVGSARNYKPKNIVPGSLYHQRCFKMVHLAPDMVVHAWNPSTLGKLRQEHLYWEACLGFTSRSWDRRISIGRLPGLHSKFQVSLSYAVRFCLKIKVKVNSNNKSSTIISFCNLVSYFDTLSFKKSRPFSVFPNSLKWSQDSTWEGLP